MQGEENIKKLEIFDSRVDQLLTRIACIVPSDNNECTRINGNKCFSEQLGSIGQITNRLINRKTKSTTFVFWTVE